MLQTNTLYNDIKQVLPQIIQHSGISPDHPVYAGSPLYSKFIWGHIPDDCRKGEALVFAMPNRLGQSRHSLACLDENRLSFVIGILQDSQANVGEFWNLWSIMGECFGQNALNFEYTQTALTLRTETIPTPWGLGKIGVQKSEIISQSTPINMQGSDCPLLRIQMVVEWTFYTEANNRFRL